jgi:hypothetical protein
MLLLSLDCPFLMAPLVFSNLTFMQIKSGYLLILNLLSRLNLNFNVSVHSTVSSRSEFRVVMSVTKTMFCSSLPPVVCRSPCLIYVICGCFRIVVSQTFCFVCLRLVYFMLPVSLDCPF